MKILKVFSFCFFFSYIISSPRETQFIWTFQKQSSYSFSDDQLSYTYGGDRYVSLFVITFTSSYEDKKK